MMPSSSDAVPGTGARTVETDIRVVTTDAAVLPEARAILTDWLDEFDAAASIFHPDSELSLINTASVDAAAFGEETMTVAVSDTLADILGAALTADALTGGLATRSIGVSGAIRLDDLRLTIRPGTVLDIEVPGRSWVADRAAQAITEQLGGGVLVELGGDIACAGTAPLRGWRIGIVDWRGSTRQTVSAHTRHALSTSSRMMRRWSRIDDADHSPIIDPRTGDPAGGNWAQVTCGGPNAVQANAASVAAIVLGDDAVEWLTLRGIPALLIDLFGREHRVGGWPPLNPDASDRRCLR